MPIQDQTQARLAAHSLFHRAHRQERLNKLKAFFTKRSRRLFELSTIRDTCAVNGYSQTKRRQVCINIIQGEAELALSILPNRLRHRARQRRNALGGPGLYT